DGDSAGLFTNSFGGTSSACPGAAGVAALVIATNPALRREEVADILRRACDRIDPQNGRYNAAGRSRLYGWGRLNARTAVELARPQPRNEVTVSRRFDAPLPDRQTTEFALDVPAASVAGAAVDAVSVAVDIRHTFIGNLVLTLVPPVATGVAPVVLHRRSGGTRNGIKKVYDSANTPRLAAFKGKACQGRWTLKVQDAQAKDSGTLHSFSVRLVFAATAATNPVAPSARSARSARSGPARKTPPARKAG
ncbi:MAG: proprotein convertase P-domain-containing protein, partial [Chitinophagaceae bacterium]|nr:proprotein convertase P-domain-containing protein [Rubrivivax sp.]